MYLPIKNQCSSSVAGVKTFDIATATIRDLPLGRRPTKSPGQ
jgi:hypothetical protein